MNRCVAVAWSRFLLRPSWVAAVALIGATAGLTGPAAVRADESDETFGLNVAGTMELSLVDAETGSPLADVEIRTYAYPPGERTKMRTDKEGKAAWSLSAEAKRTRVSLTIEPATYVPVHYDYYDEQQRLALPKKLTIRFVRGTKIGGVVRDADGQPIEGAKLRLSMPATFAMSSHYYMTLGEAETNAEGRWELATAPPTPFDRLIVSTTHPDFLPGRGGNPGDRERGLRAQTHEIVLERGVRIAGRVVDAQGEAVAGAQLALGDYFGSSDRPRIKSNGQGEFEFPVSPPGPTVITVQKSGFAPQLVRTTVDSAASQAEPITIVLDPGLVLRGTVVDDGGDPISGAIVVADTWRGARSLQLRLTTDKNGFFIWTSAPSDVVLFDILKEGFLADRRHGLVASAAGSDEPEHRIVLQRPFAVSGTAVDAESGERLARFRVVPGWVSGDPDRVYWDRQSAAEFTDGDFAYRWTEPRPGCALRIEAEGYAARPIGRVGNGWQATHLGGAPRAG